MQVVLCTLAPYGAPAHVRPQFITLRRVHDGQPPQCVELHVRRVELLPLLEALRQAAELLELARPPGDVVEVPVPPAVGKSYAPCPGGGLAGAELLALPQGDAVAERP